jgi:hypothetical protein
MADIELVIKLPEDVIENAKSSPNYYPTYLFEMIWIAIRNGKPLPKRMLSVDLIIETLCLKDEDYDYPCIAPSYLEEELERLLLDDAPTIIEADADKEE